MLLCSVGSGQNMLLCSVGSGQNMLLCSVVADRTCYCAVLVADRTCYCAVLVADRAPAGRVAGDGGVGVRENHAARRQRVQVRCLDGRVVVGAHLHAGVVA